MFKNSNTKLSIILNFDIVTNWRFRELTFSRISLQPNFEQNLHLNSSGLLFINNFVRCSVYFSQIFNTYAIV